MSDINDDAKHIQTFEKFLQVCVERVLDKNEKTNDKLYVIASYINAITEFIVAEADYARLRQNETDKQLMAIALHLGNNLQE
jgi:hypothetical protein